MFHQGQLEMRPLRVTLALLRHPLTPQSRRRVRRLCGGGSIRADGCVVMFWYQQFFGGGCRQVVRLHEVWAQGNLKATATASDLCVTEALWSNYGSLRSTERGHKPSKSSLCS
jgi:hypothetical protein